MNRLDSPRGVRTWCRAWSVNGGKNFCELRAEYRSGSGFTSGSANNISLVVAFFGVTGVTGVLASVTDWLAAIGWAGVWMVAVGFGLLIALIVAGIRRVSVGTAIKRHELQILERWGQRDDINFNPLETTFHTKRLRVDLLAHPIHRHIFGKRFIDCELVGPANIIFIGNCHPTNNGAINCDFVAVLEYKLMYNVFVFQDCDVLGGAFINCTIYSAPQMVRRFRDLGATFVTLTPEND